jgi:undecaprenyl pyrophosphate phosphatase UppP
MQATRTEAAPQGSERLGAIMSWGFGVAWAAWGISGIADSTVQLGAIVVAVVLAIATLTAVLRGGPTTAEGRQLHHDWRRNYNMLVLAEVVAIFLASAALGSAELPELIPVAICMIVGVHFFPLAGVFNIATYRWTAIGLCAVAVAGAALYAAVSGGTVRAVVGLGASLVLWTTTVAVVRNDLRD